MPRLVAFLRAVNVGGRSVKMDALRAAFESLALARVETFIASGNVIFDSKARDLGALERTIEAQLQAAFGFEIHTFVRTVAEVYAIVAHPAFDTAQVAGAGAQVVGLLRSAPDAAALRTIERLATDVDRLQVHGRELYWLSRHKQSELAFSNAVFERALQVRTTFRGIDTLRRLVARLAAAG